MNSNFLHQGSVKVLLGIILIFGFILGTADKAYSADKPSVPKLSLSGDEEGYNEKWYPDGMVRMVPSDHVGNHSEAKLRGREFLLPIFIDNKWTKYPGIGETIDGKNGSLKGDMYVPDEIHSFEFKLQYDSSVLRPIAIQKFHPYEDEDDEKYQTAAGDYYEPLAKDFHVEMDDWKDTSYRWFIFGDEPTGSNDKKKGRTLKITGTSTKPLPHCDLDASDYRILLYVKFRIVTTGGTSQPKPIYIMNDTIRYNDMNVCMDCPFIEFRGLDGYDPSIFDVDYQDPNPTNNPRYFINNAGLAGLTNYSVHAPNDTDQQSVFAKTQQIFYRPGAIWIKFSQASPEFDFYVPDSFISYPISDDPVYNEWLTLVEPITIDSINPDAASRTIFIQNGLDDSRLMDVEIESDQKWLLFRTIAGNNNQNPISNFTRKGRINMIDRGILGEFDENDPVDNDTEDDGDVELSIRCDPLQLDWNDEEEDCGIYVGYITFTSPYAKVSPVRLKVTFIYFKNPEEWVDPTRKAGMEIVVKNANSDEVNLVFGSGPRATRGVDTLYGEYAYESPMNENFDARWFPPPGWEPLDENKPAENNRLVANGFGDWSPNAWNPISNSRDIRDVDDDTESLIYLCKFTLGDPADYPVTVEWDVRDFPDGSQLFLRDVLNGEYFNVNMVTGGTKLPDDPGTRRSYTIEDANFRSFLIEYTPARTITYVDANGNPKIKRGWNLLSLPVRPVNTEYQTIYPNAINTPYYYSQAQYQDAPDLVPGVGYFIKYHTIVDTIFAGSWINEINHLTNDAVRLFSGWNTIGALSVPTEINNITFDSYQDAPVPQKLYTLQYGVWGYTTNIGYEEVSVLDPGLGYWIKVGILNDEQGTKDAVGYLNLTTGSSKLSSANDVLAQRKEIYSRSTMINVNDNADNKGKVYITNDENVDVTWFELPPTPPSHIFDLRFTNGGIMDNIDGKSIVNIQGMEYPLNISVVNAEKDYTFIDAATGQVFGTIKKGETKAINVPSLAANAMIIEESTSITSMNVYPNPASKFVNIEFVNTTDDDVLFKVYDIAGNEVESLVNNNNGNTISYNVTSLNAGTYICKIITGTETKIATFNVVK